MAESASESPQVAPLRARPAGRAGSPPVGVRTTQVRAWYAATAVVVWFALVLQLVLIVRGTAVDGAGIGGRLVRFVSYFTVQSNLLVAVTATTLAFDPWRDGRLWRVARLDAVVGITVTFVVYLVALRPLLDLHGQDKLADALLHIVSPVATLVGLLVFGPRPRVQWRTVGLAMLWPVAWLVYTLARGAWVHWYPYPFIDVDVHGYAAVAGSCLLVAVVLLGVASLVKVVDGRLPPRP